MSCPHSASRGPEVKRQDLAPVDEAKLAKVQGGLKPERV